MRQATMLMCEICGEDLPSPAEMRTHLLLSHLEAQVRCPLCSLAGVSYDELRFHINTAHAEGGAQSPWKQVDVGAHQVQVGPSRSRLAEISDVDARSVSNCSGVANGDSPDGVAGGGVSDVPSNEDSSGMNLTHTDGHACLPRDGSLKATHSSGETCSREEQEPIKAKQKRLSSPRKEKILPCPMCSLVFSNGFILQEHVELHLQEKGVAEGGAQCYECPLCSLTCADSSSLQLHVELHLEAGVAPGTDLQLARRLQEEEEDKRKAEEAKREAEEFKKLQRQFGLDDSGGYRRQMERSLERAVSRGHMVPAEFHRKRAEVMESLASGVDDGRTRTSGLIAALNEYYQREGRDAAHVWLSSETDHYSSSEGDRGWGCGYRNFQMLLSSLHKLEVYSGCTDGTVPSLPRVQALLEEAWRQGVDPQGASHFSHKLQGSRAWIGATEIYSLFTSFEVRARIMDFHQPTGPGNTHPRLFEWVKRYFSTSACRGTRLPPRVVQTTQPPIYLQHQGEMRKLLARDITGASLRQLRKFPGSLKHNQYQIVTVEGVLSPEEKQTQIQNSRHLCAEKVP
ncbi:hypothetical protein AAFF_G00163310 [Aldrovandia affinis]|uniref:Zinc finger-containing ubiquitin peptidase 1 n=1 Tax=Aldrovandia affinis TaxID=143900 RepID=A0AAD7WWG5_9TELE|nr:hypothetical protein AAFF_G00163310 [Aldrovandia affinis]